MSPLKKMLRKNTPKAAAVLDQIKPGWENLIDTRSLSLASPTKCVLGQVFKEEADRLGGTGYMYGLVYYHELTSFINGTGVFAVPECKEFWIEEIEKRRGPSESAQTWGDVLKEKLGFKKDHRLAA